MALKKVAGTPSKAAIAIEQFAHFSSKRGLFGGDNARCSALGGRMSAADWWGSYGGQFKELQKLAMCIVSQCMSSSGCERNWSTFALVHTKLRNRLGYDKHHKLVYVHYNLKLRIQQFEVDSQNFQEMGSDPCGIMIDVALYDEGNLIMDWLCSSMSESRPTLDEYDDDDLEFPTPSTLVIDELGMRREEVAVIKRKHSLGRKGGRNKGKRPLEEEEEDIADDYELDSPHGSPVYAESGDNSSVDKGDGDGYVGGAAGRGGA